jgi:hypothetical protein
MRYQCLEPFRAVVRNPDGTLTTIGYGIGDIISVQELSFSDHRHPMHSSLDAYLDRKTGVVLTDGSTIVEYSHWPRIQTLTDK